MKHLNSLRIRLLGIATLLLTVALGLAGFALVSFFERSVSKFIEKELMADLDQLATGLDMGSHGKPVMGKRFSDPRFHRAYGGRYWQISDGTTAVLRSRSLWDTDIKLPAHFSTRKGTGKFVLQGPANQKLLVMAANVFPVLTAAGKNINSAGTKKYTLITAIDYRSIDALKQEFATDVSLALAGLSILLMLALTATVLLGLKPLGQLRDLLSSVRSGEIRRIEGEFPSELNPLVNELNLLLEAQQDAVVSARNRAADLAHGLKTPLSVLTIESRLLRQAGQHKFSAEINRQVETMRKHVQRDLARARARGLGPAKYERMDAAEGLRTLVEVMKRLPNGTNIQWVVEVPERLVTALDRIDFNELVGNILDNARKWASSQVKITLAQSSQVLVLTVEDDGAGVPDGVLDKLKERGIRFDPTIEGSGVGLSIVHDLAELYNGSVILEKSSLGGLKVEVTLKCI